MRRWTEALGIFPNLASAERLISAILTECHDDWQIGRRYFNQELMRKLVAPDDNLMILAPVHLEAVH